MKGLSTVWMAVTSHVDQVAHGEYKLQNTVFLSFAVGVLDNEVVGLGGCLRQSGDATCTGTHRGR